MCGVIGALLNKPTQQDFDRLRRVFIESQVRGKHATGLAYVAQNTVHIISLPVPADAFPFDFPSYLNEDGNLYLIGHTRYSTSDLEFNQPIGNPSAAIVHNGVITQELPENWEKLYGHNCETRNDSELLFRSLEGDNVGAMWNEWPNASISFLLLYADKTITAGRNGKRPQWMFKDRAGNQWFTSTDNIAMRAGLPHTDRSVSETTPDLQP